MGIFIRDLVYCILARLMVGNPHLATTHKWAENILGGGLGRGRKSNKENGGKMSVKCGEEEENNVYNTY
jgi:hypothetical protein